MKEQVHLLIFNTEVLFASRNITVLLQSMYNRCVNDNHQVPLNYATVRRAILKDGKYSHCASPGYNYHIIERQLIRKPIQRRIDLFNDTVAKRSDKAGMPPQAIAQSRKPDVGKDEETLPSPLGCP